MPSECYTRTLRLITPSGHGTAFTVDRQDRQWLVTARHVVDGTRPEDLQIVGQDGPISVPIEEPLDVEHGADVAVFPLGGSATPSFLLEPTSNGCVFSQDAYFLGFPYGLGLLTSDTGGALPFVKKAIISTRQNVGDPMISLWLLDGINNPGFSGGPVVFCAVGTTRWHVAGVVSGYRTQAVAVDGGEGAVPMNTGIVVAYDIRHAVEAIDMHTA